MHEQNIPKIIHQTWKTRSLPHFVEQVREQIKKINPTYEMKLYDDSEIKKYIQNNFSKKILNSFCQLNSGAAKADFWRYCVLWNEGGIYLDIDALITKSLDLLISNDDELIITRERNEGYFNNWIMISSPRHPIILETIINCCENIKRRTSQNTCLLTGPWGPFTKAVNAYGRHYSQPSKTLYESNDEFINKKSNGKNSLIRFKIFGHDMNEYAHYKHMHHMDLYKGSLHWSKQNALIDY